MKDRVSLGCNTTLTSLDSAPVEQSPERALPSHLVFSGFSPRRSPPPVGCFAGSSAADIDTARPRRASTATILSSAFAQSRSLRRESVLLQQRNFDARACGA